MSGTLEKIWVKSEHAEPMKELDRGVLDSGKGLQGDTNYSAPRPVTIIERGRWDRVESELKSTVDPISRRANLLVSGIELKDSKGRRLFQPGQLLPDERGIH